MAGGLGLALASCQSWGLPPGQAPRFVLAMAELAPLRLTPVQEEPQGDSFEEALPPPMGLRGAQVRLLGPQDRPLAGVRLRLVEASGELVIPLGTTDGQGLATLPPQPDLDPLALWRVEALDAPGGPRSGWLPWPQRSLAQFQGLDLSLGGQSASLALAPRLQAYGRLHHHAQEPFAPLLVSDLTRLAAGLDLLLLKAPSELQARLGPALLAQDLPQVEALLEQVVPEHGPVPEAYELAANRLASAFLHGQLEGGPTPPWAAQEALRLGRAIAPAVGAAVDGGPGPKASPAPLLGGGGGGGGAPPPAIPAEPAGSSTAALALQPRSGGVGDPGRPEGASSAGALPELTATGVGP